MWSTLSSSKTPVSPPAVLDDLVQKHDVVIFSDLNDAHCQCTEQLLFIHFAKWQLDHIDIKIIDWTELAEEEQTSLATELMQHTGQPTLPHVFVGGRFVGNYSQIERAFQQGDFEPFLRQQTPADTKRRSCNYVNF